MSLKGKVALVTGASRGIGRGIALQLGEAGATVYITGRKPENYDETTKIFKVNELQSTVDEIKKRGGKGISVFVDHSDAKSVKELFDQIDKEQKGQLDILVNNAYAAVPYLFTNSGKKFYESDPEYAWDVVNNVGLRNNFISASYAAKLMIPRKTGLIVFISSFGGMSYLFNTSYGVGKAANDRLAADIAVELRGTGVSSIALWPGFVKTELVTQAILSGPDEGAKKAFSNGESIEFPGKAVVALATDPNLEKESGKVLQTHALARKYNLFDIDGTQPDNSNTRYIEYVDMLNKFRLE